MLPLLLSIVTNVFQEAIALLGGCDLVVAADPLYDPANVEPLIDTAATLCNLGAQHVLLAFHLRPTTVRSSFLTYSNTMFYDVVLEECVGEMVEVSHLVDVCNAEWLCTDAGYDCL